MFVNFFIERPIFATVIAIVITIAGIVCIPLLPVAQFPDIAPPVVQVSSQYTGASAEVVEKTVTAPLEQQINGVQGMRYMSSTSSNDGSSSINVTFDLGYDLDIAAVDVQNRVNIALPQLPDEVRRYGVTTKKKSVDFIMIVNLVSSDKTYDSLFLDNYAEINLVDVFKRISGVGDVIIFGEKKYSMRFWLDPDKLVSLGLGASDVISAIKDQNMQVASGGIGLPPSSQNQVFEYAVMTKGRLEDVKEFEEIIVAARQDGAIVKMKDVAKVELGAENYKWFSTLNSKPTSTIGIYELPGANSIDIANQVRETMKSLSKRFPKGVEYTIKYDTTQFVRESMKEVLETLFIAVFLVFGVIYLFLQDWRSTLIPAITIPVSLIGTFAVMMALGFSINLLTLFGLVLAIGIVVDDSIVVVENTSRVIEDERLLSKDAAKKGMSQVVGPVIATTMVLLAVFVPVGFMPGISGQMYKQFALTIAISVTISAINALTLSPALCAIVLREKRTVQNKFFILFNEGFDLFRKFYESAVDLFISKWKIVLASFLGLILLTILLFRIVPTGFVPEEDQGYFFTLMTAPEGMSLERNKELSSKIEKMMLSAEGIEDVLTIGGFNIITSAVDSSSSTFIAILDPWPKRESKGLDLDSVMKNLSHTTGAIIEARVFSFNPPPISGLSTTGGFQFELQDLEGGSIDRLSQISTSFIAEAQKRKEFGRLSTNLKVNYPQYYVDLDRTKAKSLGVAISDVFSTLQTYLGSIYVNDFNKFGRVYRVFVQAKDEFRADQEDISRLYVKGEKGNMVLLSSLAKIVPMKGVQTLQRYNLYRTAEINGSSAPGKSSGQAIRAMEQTADKILPEGYGYEWTGVAYEEIKSGGQAPYIFILALIFAYLFLAAQYESWSLPLMVMLAVPLAILGALSAQWFRGLSNDIYCQVGLVMLIGLASKNAILIVEFAKDKRKEGASIIDAAMSAAKLRVRPILMTALAFILGVVPLVLASGAGAASRHSLGTAVFGGMIASTFLSLVLVPVLYVVIEGVREKMNGRQFNRNNDKAS